MTSAHRGAPPRWPALVRPERGILCAVSDRSRLPASPSGSLDLLVARLSSAAEAGVELLQIREPDLSGRDLMALVERVLAATAVTGARVMVNDRLDVALAAGAHGVHLKTESLDTALVRRLAPRAFLVGRSVHSPEGAEQAARAGADYVIVGTVFETRSKPGRAASGLDLLRETVRRCPIPVLAIGGMTADRAPDVAATGAAGMAAIQLFLGGEDAGPGVLDTTVTAIRRVFAPEGE